MKGRIELTRRRAQLIAPGLYPHWIHFFVEGDTERIVRDDATCFLPRTGPLRFRH